MNAENFNLKALMAMAHSPVRNYVIPGLTSYLIGAPSESGTVRLFCNERDHQEQLTPHSHRFDFQCWVLAGQVTNRIWSRNHYMTHPHGDVFVSSSLKYSGSIGQYEKKVVDRANWSYADSVYKEGECYSMKHNEVHSIHFSRGAKVLFFEGAQVTDTSIVIEPYVDGEHLETMAVLPWMFKKGSGNTASKTGG